MTAVEANDLKALVHLHPDRRLPAFTAGIGMILLAAAALTFPTEATLAVGAVGGWLLWLAGALMLGVALVMFTGRLRLFGVAASLSAVGLGVYLVLHPGAGALATALLLAAALIVDGSFQLAAALHLRPLQAWRWLLASSGTSLVAASLLAAGLPTRTRDAVVVLLCAALATTGAALVATSLVRAAPRR
jgi:uncharacterized membrane protein HdeD (DUF308 family)